MFERADAAGFEGPRFDHHATAEAGHGRHEERSVSVIYDPVGLGDATPRRPVERAAPEGDPDPKAPACDGLLRGDTGGVRLRFVSGRPASQVTEGDLGWVRERLRPEGRTVLVLVWDNASWHVSQRVWVWSRPGAPGPCGFTRPEQETPDAPARPTTQPTQFARDATERDAHQMCEFVTVDLLPMASTNL